jgi:heat shock protein HslJ
MKKNKLLLAIIILLVLLGVIGIYQYLSEGKNQPPSTPQEEVVVLPTAAAVTPEIMVFEGKPYTLTAYQTASGTMQKVPANIEVTATFNQGQVSGKAACNNYNGSYTVTGQSIQFGPVSSTQMACPPAVMKAEQMYLNNLNLVEGYAVSGTTLTLTDSGGKPVLEFEAVPQGLSDTACLGGGWV